MTFLSASSILNLSPNNGCGLKSSGYDLEVKTRKSGA
nr:MAG TPA: hypothetical protein [Caudoviricetes sp.]